ncbi:MAG: alpha-ribazole phosphatase [Firmicutes bacterium HGW-Firmicutes-15]|nr:MAG: alpha-ribazole phosphatase [Firmicutes bacterium HGW-Firmicutes-15]
MRIIMVRHGQTDWNAQQKYQGQSDIPLNETGRAQAYQTALHLQDQESPQVIFCSDLMRARETAQIIGRSLGIESICDARLRELSFGEWEGMTFTEVYEKYPQAFNEWVRDTETYIVPGGESFQSLSKRVLQFIHEIKQANHQVALLVTHGGVIKAVLRHADECTDLWENAVETASFLIIDITEEGRILICKN